MSRDISSLPGAAPARYNDADPTIKTQDSMPTENNARDKEYLLKLKFSLLATRRRSFVADSQHAGPHDHQADNHSGLLEPRGTSTVRKDPGVRDMTTWSVSP